MWNFYLHFQFSFSVLVLDHVASSMSVVYFTFVCVYCGISVENWVFGNVVALFYFLFLVDNVQYLKFYGSVLVCTFVCLVCIMSINFIEGSMCVVCLSFDFVLLF